MKKGSLKRLFDNNRFVQVFSIIAAALCWLAVAMTQSTRTTVTVYHVPVKIDPQSTALTSIGLHVIESDDMFLNIDVEGLRTVVGGLTPDDFSITTRLAGVTDAGTYELTPVSITPVSSDYTIKGFSRKTITVRFDRMDRVPFTVEDQINGLAIAPGYAEKTTVVSPDTVTIQGPSASLEKIARCAITAELANPLDKTFVDEFPIILYDASGDVLDPNELRITMDRTEAQLMIQVLKTASVPLKVDFTNIPRGFPKDELLARTHISQDSVTIAGPAELIDKTSEILLDYISIKTIEPEHNTFSFDVPLPPPSEQFMRLDNITTVVVTVDSSDLDAAVFNVHEPVLINVPVGFDVELLADVIPNVKFVGKKSVLETMTAADIVAEIDLSEREIASGSYNFPVKLSVPGKGLVWAVGDHSVTIQVTDARQQS